MFGVKEGDNFRVVPQKELLARLFDGLLTRLDDAEERIESLTNEVGQLRRKSGDKKGGA